MKLSLTLLISAVLLGCGGGSEILTRGDPARGAGDVAGGVDGHHYGIVAIADNVFGEGYVSLRWNGGPNVRVRGHYTVFKRRAWRAALLLATLLLMRPGTLDTPPAAPP